MRKLTEQVNSKQHKGSIGIDLQHESAVRHVSGEARYVDDIPEPADLLHAAIGPMDLPVGRITKCDLKSVRIQPGIVDVITIDEVPGHTDIAPVFDGDPVLAEQNILFRGQPVFATLAHSAKQARMAAMHAHIEVDAKAASMTAAQAHEEQNFVRPTHVMRSGDAPQSMDKAAINIKGEVHIGGQEHLYLEGQVALAIPEEEDRICIYTSSQHPSEVQKLVAEVLGIGLHKVTVDMRRMGGGFGGKETQAAQWACLAAILAKRNNKPVKLRVPRMQDMITTGKRHPFYNQFNVGTDAQGVIASSIIDINGLCGHSADLSEAIVDRAMFHCDNAYSLGEALVTGYRCRTDTVSHTAFRGFGGPQGMVVGEAMMDAIARRLRIDPLTVRKRNLYGESSRNVTHYGMTIPENILPELIAQLEASSDYWQRREEITRFNQSNTILKKGLALTPVKFGISFTAKHLNQAGALVHVYTDGTIQVNHGGTEMGQGLHTKIQQIAAQEFGLPVTQIEVTSTRTDKVPNTSPTAASSGTDINGKAVQNACVEIKQRLCEYWLEEIKQQGSSQHVHFEDGQVRCDSHTIAFSELIQQAYMNRVSLSATGFYRTPKIHYNRETGKGRPFFYFANGAAVSEVTVDTLTGEYKVNRVDILHDVGASLNPAIDKGQIEGGFIQGMGWLTTEELIWSEDGKLLSNNPATYKIPAIGDLPEEFNVALFDRANSEDAIYASKAVGEPPLMLAISVWCALKDAIASLQDYKVDPVLHPPATPEKVLWSIQQLKGVTQ
ncbi:MAG: xanthine dehydrogenase molybdopterin binding subunit [Aestuariibacter sp.]